MSQPNLHSALPFLPFVKALEAIYSVKQSTVKKTEEKKHYLKCYIEAFNDAKEKFIQQHGKQSYTSFYPILRLLLPFQDKSRTYGMKESVLGRLYINMLALGDQSSDAALLKAGTLNKGGTDFGDVVYEVMRDRSKQTGICKINDINNFLDKLSSGDINEGKAEFSRIFLKLTALEHKWITRMILKSLRLDLSEKAILAVLHPKAGELINRLFSLEKLCEIFESNQDITEELISAQSIDPFIPFRPQLCNRMVENQLNELIRKQEMFAETKMDGERMQMHRKGDEYRYFTRHGNDCSVQFGMNTSTGCFTPLVHTLFKIPISDMILDGEMMVWDRHDLRFVVKGENVSARTMTNHGKYQSCYVVYDLLYLNGKSFINTGYQERINTLNTMFDNAPGKLMKVPRQKVRSCIQVLEVLNNAIDEQEEGVVLKQIDSLYHPGKRGEGWFKIKPDYLGNLVTDLDLVIIGAIYRKGTSYVQKYLVAIKDETQTTTKFITVTPIVNNLSYDDSKVLQNTLNPVMKPYFFATAPSHLDFGVYKPDVYIEPSDSIILEVKASELQKSHSVSTGYILRFPRVTQIRKDKPPTDCCDINEFKNLCGIHKVNDKVVKLPKRHATEADLTTTHKRAPKRVKIDPTPTVNLYTSKSDVKILDDIAKGLKICVLSSGKGKSFPPKEELEMLVRKHGGQVVAIPGRDTNFCVAHTETPMVLTILQNRSQTIVSVSWFSGAFPATTSLTELLDITRKDTLCMKPDFEAQLIYKYDENGDHYTRELTKEELTQQLNEMDVMFPLLINECEEIERMIIGRTAIYNMFRDEIAFFDTDLYTSIDYKIAKLTFISRSGTTLNVLGSVEEGDDVKVVVDGSDLEKLALSKSKVPEVMKKACQLIDYQYFVQISKGFTSEQKDYLINF